MVNQCQQIDTLLLLLMIVAAMQKKPVGESRIPTDYWSGLGFSRSMPASAIRERLNLNNSAYDGPKMTAPYEVRNSIIVSPSYEISSAYFCDIIIRTGPNRGFELF